MEGPLPRVPAGGLTVAAVHKDSNRALDRQAGEGQAGAETRIFGIRHHGPGSARSLRRALEAMQPDCILVEGPPDAEAVLPHLAHEGMQPPLALLLYMPEEPSRCVYYPLAVFSPEWQAMYYARMAAVPLRFMDLPQEHQLAMEEEGTEPGDPPQKAEAMGAEPLSVSEQIRRDPLNWIAEAAGYSDGETWWEHMVEQRNEDQDLFEAVLEIMGALREAAPEDAGSGGREAQREALREAWMRQTLRAAHRDGFRRVAVVCGAWHAPALATLAGADDDAKLLKGLPKVKTAATWVPWTYGRLTYASGYGAGVVSPAWYEHLWLHRECISPHWMTSVAALFREEDLPASPASVIEAVRLAETLAAVRDRPLPGLPELWEAAQSVFCSGSDLPMRLIRERLVVGERLGQVADTTPMLPIQMDLRKEQRRLRLAPGATAADKDFDLRNATDLARSILLHRLNILSVLWGTVTRTGGGKGTFHEIWRLQWQPEFEVKLIEANIYGNTVMEAAARYAGEAGARADTLSALTALVEQALLADLHGAIPPLMDRLESMSAVTSDVPRLMDAIPPLAGVLRYGNVRQTDTRIVGHALDGLVTRTCIGLPAACASLNDDAAAEMLPRIMAVHEALQLLQNRDYSAAWTAALERLADLAGLHGLIYGRCCRLLLDLTVWRPAEIERRMNLALSPAEEPARAAAWIDGLLRGSGDLLVHTDTLWPLLDRWVSALPADQFPQLLPLLRRTIGTFPPPLRRQLGERARGEGQRTTSSVAAESGIDADRAARVLPLLTLILGLAPAAELE